MSRVTVTLRTPSNDEEVTLETQDSATMGDLYRFAQEQRNLQIHEFRFVRNGEVVEPEEADEVSLEEGEQVDVIREASNGS